MSTRRHGLEWKDHVHVEAAAGWPLVKGNSTMASPESRTVDVLAQEVEELIERQPQFAFLKPCRQLENHYASKRAGNDSGRHGHGSTAIAEAMADMKPKGSVDSMPKHQPRKNGSTIRELLSCDGIELNGFVEGKSGAQPGASSTARVVTKEYHNGRGHFHRNSGERIWRISSTRCSIHEKEAHIDLVNPAAAKFLMEIMSPGAQASPPAVAVPFKWEDAPGRAKARDAEATTNPTLQLPPRLAVPFQRNVTRQLVISHPLAGIFPCINGATSPSPPPPPQQHQQQRQQQRQPQPQQQQHQHQHQQQDHITWMHYRASKSYGGVHRKQNCKSFSQPLASTDQSLPGLKPRRLFSSELASSDASTSSRSSSSILHGSQQSSSSRTYLSCELDASTPGSKSSSSASYESIGEDFDHDEPASASPQALGQSRRAPGHRRSGLLKLCKSHGNCLRKSKSSRRRIQCSPEGLATYFQRLDVNNDEPLLEKQGAAPTSSGYLNSKGEPQPLQRDQPAMADAGDGSSEREIISPKRPTRLPYKMPSVAEQEGRGKTPRHRSALSVDLHCPSPAYAAALEMLSPAAVTLMTSRRHRGSSRTPPPPKPHRRVQFILSMCKTLKRVLFRQQPRRSVIGTRLMYHDERAPTTFQFSKPN